MYLQLYIIHTRTPFKSGLLVVYVDVIFVTSDDHVRIETVRDTTSLTVNKCKACDSGKYSLTVSNDFGTDNMSASVTVEGARLRHTMLRTAGSRYSTSGYVSDKPDAPVGQPVASNIKTTSMTLAWSGPSYDGGAQVTDYRVEMSLNGRDAWKTLTSNCKVRPHECTRHHCCG